jgi:hypothetical protein
LGTNGDLQELPGDNPAYQDALVVQKEQQTNSADD